MKLPIVALNGYQADLENDVLVLIGETAKGAKVSLEVTSSAIGPLALMLLKAAREFPRPAPGEGTIAQPLNLDEVKPALLEDGRIAFDLTLEGAASVVVVPSSNALTTLSRCLSSLPEDEDVPSRLN